MGNTIDLTGIRVGKLIVIGPAERKNGRTAWHCKCDCGNETTVLTQQLTHGLTKSCGCYQKERASETFKRHGMYGTRLYRIWSNMIQRCSNPKNNAYLMYGAKGVSVCAEWKVFNAFCQWAMSNGYDDGLSIDRIDNSKGYSPDNCRWATSQEQTDNRVCVRYVFFNGKTQTLKKWAEETGIPYDRLSWRIRNGWPIEKALTTK